MIQLDKTHQVLSYLFYKFHENIYKMASTLDLNFLCKTPKCTYKAGKKSRKVF